MQILVILIPLAILGACSREPEVPPEVSACVAGYDGKALDQCVAACKKCEHGVTVTCTTACRLRGAK